MCVMYICVGLSCSRNGSREEGALSNGTGYFDSFGFEGGFFEVRAVGLDIVRAMVAFEAWKAERGKIEVWKRKVTPTILFLPYLQYHIHVRHCYFTNIMAFVAEREVF